MKLKNKIIDKVIVIVISTITLLLISFFNSSRDIPVIRINLNDTTLEEIITHSKEVKYKDNSIEIIDTIGNKKISDITIKGRGNSTWTLPKRSFQIKFDDDINLFNLGTSNKYVLLANYLDETLLRTHVAFAIGRKLGLDYTFNGVNVNLYIDDEYQGVYYLTNKIEISDGSVNLKNNDAVIVELDNVYYYREDNYKLSSYKKDHLVLKDVKSEKFEETAFNNFMDKYNKVEKAIDDNDWETISELIDVESFVKYYIISKLSSNGDAYRSSFYMYMDGNDDKIHAGPIWDFDIAFLNDAESKTENIDLMYVEKRISRPKDETNDEESMIVTKLAKFKKFKSLANDIWEDKMANTLQDWLNEIENLYVKYKDSADKNIHVRGYPNSYRQYIDEFKDNFSYCFKNVDSYLNWAASS